jgi:hypothetical protein
MFGFKKREKTVDEIEAEEERKKYQLDIAKAKREAYWTSRKEAEIKQASVRGASYKPFGSGIGGTFKTIGKGMTAKGGFLDFSEVKGKKSSGLSGGLGIGEPSSEFGDWLGGSSVSHKRHHKTHRRPKHKIHRKHGGRRVVKIIKYY